MARARKSPPTYWERKLRNTKRGDAALFDNLNFNFIRDMALLGVSRGPLVVAVHPSLPVKTIPEFITYAKANPGKIAMGSSGTGGINHMAGELFRAMTGINMTHVPYRGDGLAQIA